MDRFIPFKIYTDTIKIVGSVKIPVQYEYWDDGTCAVILVQIEGQWVSPEDWLQAEIISNFEEEREQEWKEQE